MVSLELIRFNISYVSYLYQNNEKIIYCKQERIKKRAPKPTSFPLKFIVGQVSHRTQSSPFPLMLDA